MTTSFDCRLQFLLFWVAYETRNMDEEHTRGTIMNFLKVIAFIYLLVRIFYYVFDVFKLKSLP